MSDLFGIGLSGLNAAQSGLQATSNNVSNVNTPGYTRRSAIFEQAPESRGQGSGVLVTGIQRHYQQFVSEQLDKATSRGKALETHLDQMSHINNLLGESDAGLAPLMQSFFSSVQTLAANPSDPAAREALLGDAHNMASQFRTFSSYLSDMDDGVEEQLRGAIKQVNNYGKQIAHLNHQITMAKARTGQEPNKLLDERNRLVSELSELTDPKVTTQDGDQYTVMVGGRALVDANGAHSFAMTQSSEDTSKRVIAYKTVGGSLREIDPKSFTGGTIGGLITFREDSLEPTQLRLNQLAHAFSASVNRVHASGFDLDDQTGQVFFDGAKGSQPTVAYAHQGNDSDVSVDLSASDVTGTDNYRIQYAGTNSGGDDVYKVVTIAGDGSTSSEKVTSTSGSGKVEWGGGTPPANSVKLSAVPDEGDSFLVRTSGSFSTSNPVSYANDRNSGDATMEAHFNGNLSEVVPSNYRLRADGSGNYDVTRLSDGTVTHVTPDGDGNFTLGGMTVHVDATSGPDEGDSFLIKPLAGSADSMNVAISDPAKIAAANPNPTHPDISNGSGDNGNMLELADIQNRAIVGGQASPNDAYAQLVSDVGNKTNSLQVNSAAQDSLTEEYTKAEQSVSGVNLAEERVNLMYYSKLYRANATVIQTATTIFDTILQIR